MDSKSIKQLIVSSAAYSLSSILGPLLFLGVPAYFLDKYLNTSPLALLISVFVSFIITNVLLFKKVSKINRMIAENFPPPAIVEKDQEQNSSTPNKIN